MKHAYRWTAPLALSLLSACGGSSHSSAPATVTIGGSISGLSASGLVLANGTATVAPMANATSFQFATAVATGSTYNVTVQTQPTGETCTVSAAGGTARTNVTSVVVSCTATTPPVTFTIGGTVEGLSASANGLVLLDNNGDALTITPAATAAPFTFATALNSGSHYTVTVQTQPAGETCNVYGGAGTASADVTTVAISCSQYAASVGTNVVPVTVGNGPTGATSPTFNIPYVTVKVCEPDTSTCATINNVEVDTGSVGLRLLASALANPDSGSPVSLPSFPDPGTPANTISECWHFGGTDDAWGPVATADVDIGAESATGVEVQVINDATPAANCSGTQYATVSDFDANGVLGVGVMAQDCGSGCGTVTSGDYYYTCTSGGSCTQVGLAPASQVPNPVTGFTTTMDDNGVILQLPAIPPDGLATANGYLVFGIGTESDNGLGSATVLTTNASGEITTTLSDSTAASALFDSGSNSLEFSDPLDPDLSTCMDNSSFYCPASTLSLSATNEGANSVTSSMSFQVASLDALAQSSSANYALDDVAGPGGPTFDWGLPFFYGKTVFVAIDGQATPGGTGPYYAY